MNSIRGVRVSVGLVLTVVTLWVSTLVWDQSFLVSTDPIYGIVFGLLVLFPYAMWIKDSK